MHAILRNLTRAFGRLFPNCVTLSQAIAFNMFLAFFPLLLLLLGVLSGTPFFHQALSEIPTRLVTILPPGSSSVVVEYFVRGSAHPWRWIALGLGGTLIAGTQVMIGYMEGFRVIEGDLLQPGYLRRQLRALLLLCVTIVPMMIVMILTVFTKQLHTWHFFQTGSSRLTRDIGWACYALVIFVLAMVVLVSLYRIGRPGHASYRALLPGAVVSTVLWWVTDLSFGLYVRKMPYDVIYRGLASAIGLLVWMFLTAVIVLLGAAYNAEVREAAQSNKLLLFIP
ncbi:MAG TPA: YihY/virulence factor BrkB family protein [Candidatus Acidoferrales bacterium]